MPTISKLSNTYVLRSIIVEKLVYIGLSINLIAY
jgi:hypothetical protein